MKKFKFPSHQTHATDYWKIVRLIMFLGKIEVLRDFHMTRDPSNRPFAVYFL